MSKEELKSLKDRSIAKHLEIQKAIHKIEQEYIQDNCPYKIGDSYDLGLKKIKSKVIPVKGYVYKISVCYDRSDLPLISMSIYSKMSEGFYLKTVYL